MSPKTTLPEIVAGRLVVLADHDVADRRRHRPGCCRRTTRLPESSPVRLVVVAEHDVAESGRQRRGCCRRTRRCRTSSPLAWLLSPNDDVADVLASGLVVVAEHDVAGVLASRQVVVADHDVADDVAMGLVVVAEHDVAGSRRRWPGCCRRTRSCRSLSPAAWLLSPTTTLPKSSPGRLVVHRSPPTLVVCHSKYDCRWKSFAPLQVRTSRKIPQKDRAHAPPRS